MAERQNFKKSVARLKREQKEEMGQFIAYLKSMSPEEFLRLPRRDIERLSPAQYAEIAQSIVPNVTLGTSEQKQHIKPTARPRKITAGRRSTMAVIGSVLAGLIVAFAGPTIVERVQNYDLVRPASAESWPICRRLTAKTDGCVYIPKQNLNWDYVAQSLHIDRAFLLTLNRHLPVASAPAERKIIVWRGAGRLEN